MAQHEIRTKKKKDRRINQHAVLAFTNQQSSTQLEAGPAALTNE
jgi:hypothetical protein